MGVGRSWLACLLLLLLVGSGAAWAQSTPAAAARGIVAIVADLRAVAEHPDELVAAIRQISDGYDEVVVCPWGQSSQPCRDRRALAETDDALRAWLLQIGGSVRRLPPLLRTLDDALRNAHQEYGTHGRAGRYTVLLWTLPDLQHRFAHGGRGPADHSVLTVRIADACVSESGGGDQLVAVNPPNGVIMRFFVGVAGQAAILPADVLRPVLLIAGLGRGQMDWQGQLAGRCVEAARTTPAPEPPMNQGTRCQPVPRPAVTLESMNCGPAGRIGPIAQALSRSGGPAGGGAAGQPNVQALPQTGGAPSAGPTGTPPQVGGATVGAPPIRPDPAPSLPSARLGGRLAGRDTPISGITLVGRPDALPPLTGGDVVRWEHVSGSFRVEVLMDGQRRAPGPGNTMLRAGQVPSLRLTPEGHCAQLSPDLRGRLIVAGRGVRPVAFQVQLTVLACQGDAEVEFELPALEVD
jgi:hypothetical protein